MIDFSKLWDKVYLLGPNPIVLSRSDKVFFVLAVIFIIAAVAAKFLSRKEHGESPKGLLFSRFFHLFVTFGILILIWSAARTENIPWISTHLVVLLMLLIWFVWLGFILRFFWKKYPEQKKQWDEEQLRRKYLP